MVSLARSTTDNVYLGRLATLVMVGQQKKEIANANIRLTFSGHLIHLKVIHLLTLSSTLHTIQTVYF